MSLHPIPYVEVFSKPDCHLCAEAKSLLQHLQASHAFLLQDIDISSDPVLLHQYGAEVPVIVINQRKGFKYRVEPRQFLRYLQRLERAGWRRFWP
jgi:glutaredoxin